MPKYVTTGGYTFPGHDEEYAAMDAQLLHEFHAKSLHALSRAALAESLAQYDWTIEDLRSQAQRRLDLQQHNQRRYHNDMTEDGTMLLRVGVLDALYTYTRHNEDLYRKWQRDSIALDLGTAAFSYDTKIHVPAQFIVDALKE